MILFFWEEADLETSFTSRFLRGVPPGFQRICLALSFGRFSVLDTFLLIYNLPLCWKEPSTAPVLFLRLANPLLRIFPLTYLGVNLGALKGAFSSVKPAGVTRRGISGEALCRTSFTVASLYGLRVLTRAILLEPIFLLSLFVSLVTFSFLVYSVRFPRSFVQE